MTTIKINQELLSLHHSEGQIKAYMREYNFTYIQAVLYLWAFNNAHIHLEDFKTDCGRPMFKKFADCVKDLFEVE